KWICESCSADHGTKIEIIQQNQHLYSVSAICNVLQIARSTFYYETSVSLEKEPHKETGQQ
ncbi:hypothetical protein A1A1_16238, partial [Planococcus antarcticus DSM 14505]